ncbi:MAG: glycosyltransferase family 39 protein [Ignavibacteria bacterium]|nr:glycosyltransferase family 39 protein [Ignavibacteria bacterium]MBT8383537.1 glycosyltransferase family 39 protein [Ignavibacteria bacterium]MBT8390496.1 glycosyltransferase family 39 protein [Ignavibacteria bacterium]NNJ52566.1 glycosyltransferase family 39 protein [Ignavibacteriaceae bacterium]NNL20039.1 glycosyltransferase family 39 protein [Ignavibacteriaceae bacterium]
MDNKNRFTIERSTLVLILIFSIIKLLIHLYTNAFAGYGIFRDELYYLSCATRPDFGYVDQPPFSIWILGLIRFIIGDSVVAIRLLPAILGAATVFVTGLMVKQMGGGKLAILIASLAVILAPIYFGMNTFYSMNSFDIFLWALAFYFILRIIQQDKKSLWIWFGVILGIGLLNKVSFLWFGFGFFAALLLTDKRRLLATSKPWMVAGIAFSLFLPFIIWNAAHNWAHVEFIQNAQMYKYAGITRWDFVSGILPIMNPAAALIWLSGLFFLFISKDGKQFRILGIIFIATFLILFISGKSKSEYLAPAFTVLFAAGGIALEKINQIKYWQWLKHLVIIPLIILGIVLTPLALPILPVKEYINYASTLGFGPTTAESKELAELPQFYADMHGWEDMAKNVSFVYQQIPENEKPFTFVYGRNYGQAGAMEYFSTKYDLPNAISSHNNFWFWVDTTKEVKNIIIIGGRLEDHLDSFIKVDSVFVHKTRYAMPYENNLTIFMCKKLKRSLSEIWVSIRHYE